MGQNKCSIKYSVNWAPLIPNVSHSEWILYVLSRLWLLSTRVSRFNLCT